ncbi:MULTISPECIES: amino acid ABC transporter permease [Thalassobaculum]|uniref:Amino acid ABC transporter membrane protein 1, PAAT family n=1 Tax=Thalassobaculum litoreum DSM 18839 TaxID=1123362 RepID=A0A8G2BE83_9PROT|nr:MULTISPECIES: ABC transporter permease subunit [Thalassobaculum]SDF13975.1 amino acid ABC transporter membrane protein 1, PAAT family [Thalassobaculum litoreum DSM 18839]
MSAVDKAVPRRDARSISEIVNDERFRSIFYQIIVAVAVIWTAQYLITNTAENLQARGMSTGFEFLSSTAGFSIAWSIIDYEAGDTYFHVYLVGIANTLIVSFFAIIATTLLGFVVGVMRLSSNFVVAQIASAYVEVMRNVPLLLHILFWFTLSSALPSPKQSLGWLDSFFLNNRGLYVPAPVPGDGFDIVIIMVLIGIAVAYGVTVWATKRQMATGQRFPAFWTGVGLVVGLPLLAFFALGAPLTFDYPALKGFNFQGGADVPRAFCALLFALVLYHTVFMAEAVRAGILSVSHGQTEASYSLGLKPSWTLRLVVIPQAMRAVVPPMISNWMNVVKNSSLAIAIGYPDLVAVFMQTSLNQSGHAIEIVAMVMLFYMTVSLTISAALNYYNKLVQIKER